MPLNFLIQDLQFLKNLMILTKFGSGTTFFLLLDINLLIVVSSYLIFPLCTANWKSFSLKAFLIFRNKNLSVGVG